MKENSGFLRLSRLILFTMAFVMLSFCFTHPAEAAKKKATVSGVKVTNLPAKTLTLTKGKSFKLKVKVEGTGKFNKKVTYKSSKKKVATVSSSGKIKAKKNGTAKITVASKGNKKKKYVITVKVGTPVKTVALDRSSVSLNKGGKVQLKATLNPTSVTNKKLIWSSSDTSVVSVNSSGLVTALKVGKATITVLAEDGSGKKAYCAVNVTEPKIPPKKTATPTPTKAPVIELKSLNIVVPETMKVGETTKVQVNYLPKNAKTVLSFSVDKNDVAEISADGSLKAKANGTVKISVSAKDAAGKTKTASANVTVWTPVIGVSLNEQNISLFEDEEKQLIVSVLPETASNKKVTFVSEDKDVATVDENGLVKAKKAGNTKVTAKTEDGSFSADCAVEVKKYSVESVLVNCDERLLVGSTIQAIATAQPEKADVTITFKGDNPDVAEVSEDGKVTGKANGIVNVKATAKDSYGNEVTDEKKVTVWTAVSEIKLDPSKISVYEGTETPLKATVLPESASFTKVSYSSEDENIAKVDSNGMVTAVSPGTTTITALSEDGEHSAVCSVEVKELLTTATVDSQQALEEALQNPNLQQLTIASDQNISLVIPDGSYENVVLIIDAPNGHVENHATFQNIVINSISSTTFVECAVGNIIVYKSADGRILVDEQAVLDSLTVASGASDLDLVNNGSISNITISTQANVSISGSSESRLDVNATEDAQNAEVHTSITLRITAEAVISIDLKPGSENTLVSVDKKEKTPAVTGIGEVPVYSRETGETEVIMAENNGQTTKTLKVSGNVRDTDHNSVEGAVIRFIPFRSEISEDTVRDHLDEAVATVTTDENGSYVTDPISVGNYVVYAEAEDYSSVFRKVFVPSNYEDVYPNSDIIFVNDDEGTKGSIVGILTDTRTNEPLKEGVTVRLRKGADNKSGDYISETATASDGIYRFEDLEVGQYTVQVLDLRGLAEGSYVTEYRTLTVGAEIVTDGGFSVRFANAEDENQVTFTLTWGDEESGASEDLDSHLVGPAENGGQFHTWYSDKNYYGSDSERYDSLDYDDTDFEGPENTTIEKSLDGIYSFYVHDFTNRNSTNSDQMSRSSAVVTVHDKEQTLATFYVPNQPGTLWYVCDYDSSTGKIIPVNKMNFTDTPDEIGEDVLLKYRGLLQELLDKAEPLENKLDAELLGVMERAKTVLIESEDGLELKSVYNELRNMLNDRASKLRIYRISGENLITYYSRGYDDEDDEDDEDYSWDIILSGDINITLAGYSAALPEDLDVSLRNDSSTWTIGEDNIDPAKRMITVTSSEGNVCNYHITYDSKSNDCSIESVNANIDDFNWIDGWDVVDCKDVDGADVYELQITGYGPETEIVDHLEITASNPLATVGAIQESDKVAYNKSVTITAGETSRTYYIRWSMSTNCYIDDVSAVVDDKDLIYDWDTDYDYDEDDNRYYELYINAYGSEDDILPYLSIKTSNPGATVGAFEVSDKDEYKHSVTITAGEASRKYYIRWSISTNCSIESVSAVVDGNDLINNWYTKYIDDDDDEDIYELYLEGNGAEDDVLTHLNIVPRNPSAVVGAIEESDRDGYNKSMTITAGGRSRKYYIYWQANVDCSIKSVSAIVDGDDLISTWNTNFAYDDDESDIYELILEGYSAGDDVVAHLNIVPNNSGAVVGPIEDSDKEEYIKSVTITAGEVSRKYYISYCCLNTDDEDEDCSIESVSAIVDGYDRISGWYIQNVEDEDENVIFELYLDGYGVEDNILADYLSVVPSNPDAEVGTIEDSDNGNYHKSVTITAGDSSRKYYIRWNQLMTDIHDVYAENQDGENLLMYWNSNTAWADETHIINVLDLQGLSEGIPDNLKIETSFYDNYDTVDVAVEESDIEGYEGKINFTTFGIENTWYISYTVSDEVCAINYLDSDLLIDSSTFGSRYIGDEDDRQTIYECLFSGYEAASEAYDHVEIVPLYEGVSVSEFTESDLDGYDRMVSLSKGGACRIYYFRYTPKVDTTGLLVQAIVEDEDQVIDWYREELYAEPGDDNYDENNLGYLGEAYVVVLRSAGAKDFVEFICDTITADIVEDSDLEGYGMVTLQNDVATENFYLRFVVEESQQAEEDGIENGVEENNNMPDEGDDIIASASGQAAEAVEQPEIEPKDMDEMNDASDPEEDDEEVVVSSEEIPDE